MSYWNIAWHNMRQRALSSWLTCFSMAAGVAVMICVILIHEVSIQQFEQDAQGYHLIVGGKGGRLQLVFSTVYHLDQPLEPIPYSYYKMFTGEGKFANITEVAVPYCLGDSFQGQRVVATSTDLFNKLPYGRNPQGEDLFYKFSEGRNFKTKHLFEAVLGSVAAHHTGLKIGDKFNPSHGLGNNGKKHKEFKVVGILDSTGTANDRALFINIEGFFHLKGHVIKSDILKLPNSDELFAALIPDPHPAKEDPNRGYKPVPEALRRITSILVRVDDVKSGYVGASIIIQELNNNPKSVVQAVAPTGVITRFLDGVIGPLQIILLVMTTMIILVASISILVGIYNSMNERSHDIAVMRALGANRTAVMLIVLFESILLALGGVIMGIFLGHGMLAIAAPYIEAHTGIRIAWFNFSIYEAIMFPAVIGLASLVGLLPALSAYRTDVAKGLAG